MQERLVAGDTLNFSTTVPDYTAADGWTLVYRLVARTGSGAIELTGAADGVDPSLYRVQVPAATTAGWTPGTYSWASWVQQGAERHSLSTGVITIAANPATQTGDLDLRSDAKRALDDAKAAFYAYTPTQRRYRIAGREMEFNAVEDILRYIDALEKEVAREDRAAAMAKGYADRRKTFVRMAGV